MTNYSRPNDSFRADAADYEKRMWIRSFESYELRHGPTEYAVFNALSNVERCSRALRQGITQATLDRYANDVGARPLTAAERSAMFPVEHFAPRESLPVVPERFFAPEQVIKYENGWTALASAVYDGMARCRECRELLPPPKELGRKRGDYCSKCLSRVRQQRRRQKH